MTVDGARSAESVVFLSHASADVGFARELDAALASRNIPVWFGVDDIASGQNYAEEIYRNLRRSRCLVALVSTTALESAHVRREVNAAIDLGIPILPFSLDLSLMVEDVPLDWRYWLGIVQVHPWEGAEASAQVIQERVTPRTRPQARPASRGSRPSREQERDQVRAVLIRVAAGNGTFGMALERCRRLKIDAATVSGLAEEFHGSGLIRYTEPLSSATAITLAT